MAARSARDRAPNVVVVILDAVRAQSVRWGGGAGAAATPVLEGLVRGGATVFRRLVAPANWTIPAHMSFFTGTYPSAHGRRTFQRGAAPFETVAAWLKRQGYQTALFTEQLHIVSGYGLEDGFDVRRARRIMTSNEDRTPLFRLVGNRRILYSEFLRKIVERIPPVVFPVNALNYPQEVAFKAERCTDFVCTEFDRWIEGRDRAKPFFGFVNFVNSHEPYPSLDEDRALGFWDRWYSRTARYYLLAVPELQQLVPWAELQRGYLDTIRESDRKVGELLQTLDRAGELQRTLVVVTSDHGQSFGERGNVYHGCGATESVTRVPIAVAPPDGVSLPAVVEPWVSLCELSGWLKAAASGKAPFDAMGKAPFPFAPASRQTGVVYSEGGPASDQNRSLRGIRLDLPWNHRLIAAYQEDCKYLLDLRSGAIEYWTYPADPDHDVGTLPSASEAPELRRKIFGAYEALDAERQKSRPLAPTTEVVLDEQMRSWGYE